MISKKESFRNEKVPLPPGRRPLILSVRGVEYQYGYEPVINEASFSLNAGDKAALVGPNGVGKTTLLNIIRGEISPESGEIIIPGGVEIGYLPQSIQEVDLPENGTIGAFVKSARGLNQLEQNIYQLTDEISERPENEQLQQRYGRLQRRYDLLGGYISHVHINKLLAGVDLEDFSIEDNIGHLSGGQKTRLLLAKILYRNPSLMLLDEPSNHLDKPILDWLGNYFRRYDGALLVVSHKPDFLNRFTNQVLRLNPHTHRIETYTGNYNDAMDKVDENRRRQKKERRVKEKKIKRLKNTASRFHGKNERASQATQLEKRAKELEESLPEISDKMKTPDFNFSLERESYKLVLSAKNISFSYGDNEVISDIDFILMRGERMIILGPNGAGKTTLIKMVVGELEPDSGELNIGEKVDIGYFAQEHETLNWENTVLEEASAGAYTGNQTIIRAVLGHFLLTGDIAERKVSTMSSGERTKLALAKLILKGANFLVLDEPTNHLDTDARKQLGLALQQYPGTIILTSHDQKLIKTIEVDKVLHLPEEKLEVIRSNI